MPASLELLRWMLMMGTRFFPDFFCAREVHYNRVIRIESHRIMKCPKEKKSSDEETKKDTLRFGHAQKHVGP